jgi:Pyruvate/2-oxoacid:ferredoxin oxidoreductase delta subunit
MDAITFYYFSGTGNSKHVCDWFADEAEKSGTQVSKVNLSINRSAPNIKKTNDCIGIISPTHGFNYPPLVLYFILRFPRTKNKTKVFLMNTRAGMKLSKIFLPGLSGIALWLSALILILKGYKIISLRSIDLPSNWISLHPGLRQKVIISMFVKYEKDTRDYARKIISGKKVFRTSLWLFMPVDLAIAPVAAGYYIAGRFIIAKTFMASHLCDNCNLCINQCPIKAISTVDGRPYWSFRCESCMHCMNICPRRAIESAHGYLASVIIILYSVILAGLYSIYPPNEWPFIKNGSPGYEFIKFTIDSVLIFLLLIGTYRLVHFLKRYRWFDNLVTYTSLTKFKFWRRYKAPK